MSGTGAEFQTIFNERYRAYTKIVAGALAKQVVSSSAAAADFKTDKANPKHGVHLVKHYGKDGPGDAYAMLMSEPVAVNPYMGAAAQTLVSRICAQGLKFFDDTTELLNRLEVCTMLGNNRDVSQSIRDEAHRQHYLTSEESIKAKESYELAMRTARYISSGGSSDPGLINTHGDKIKSLFGIDLGSEAIRTAMSERRAPESIRFHAGFAGVDNNVFIGKMRDGQTPSRLEMSYAIATFDNGFRGLFGNGTGDFKQDNPMYLGKFDHLYINGRSVAELCEEQTRDMEPMGKSNYMKCFFMAQVLAQEADITVSVPGLNLDAERITLPLVSEIDRSLMPTTSKARYNGMFAEALVDDPGKISSFKSGIDRNMGDSLGGPKSNVHKDLVGAMEGLGRALSEPRSFTADNLYSERMKIDAAYQNAMRACQAALNEIEERMAKEIESKRPKTHGAVTALDRGYIENIREKASRNEKLTKEESDILKTVTKYETDMEEFRRNQSEVQEKYGPDLAILGAQLQRMATNNMFISDSAQEMHDRIKGGMLDVYVGTFADMIEATVETVSYAVRAGSSEFLREVYEDLMDIEEISLEELANPDLIDKRERDRIQTKMFDKAEAMYSKEASANDMQAFFRDRVSGDFDQNQPNSLQKMGRDESRMSLARLYMMAEGGFTLEQVFSQTPEMMEEKRFWGDRFCAIALSEDASQVGEACASMARCLINAKVPAIDLSSDESVAEHCGEIQFYATAATDLLQAMNYVRHDSPAKGQTESIVNEFRSRLSPDELKQYDDVHSGMAYTMGQAIEFKRVEILSQQYSSANDSRRDKIDFRSIDITGGTINEFSFLNKTYTAEKMAEISGDVLAAAGKSFSSLAPLEMRVNDIKRDNSISPKSDAERIRARFNNPAVNKDYTPDAPAKNTISLDDLNMGARAVRKEQLKASAVQPKAATPTRAK